MPDSAAQSASVPASPTVWYSYAIVRVVPRVERGEHLNVGVILFARTVPFLDARIELAPARLHALAPEADLQPIQRHLALFLAVCKGAPEGGPVSALAPSERFHWLTAPRSTTIQTSPVHVGRCEEPAVALDDLMNQLVRPPVSRAPGAHSEVGGEAPA
jgi:hypothetical protein